LLLLLLIASLGLGGASSSAPAGRGERADAARERARSPRQLALRLSESLLADPELVTVEPKLVLLSEERAFFNLQRLPTCAAGAEAAERASVIAERRRLVAKTGALLRALRPALVAVTHAPIEQRAELRLSHREALRLALRRFAISGAVEGSAARAQGLELLAELGARVGGAGDAYFLALAWAELGDEAAALRWLGEAFERGYRDLEQLGAEPAFASVRQRPGYRRLIDRLRPRGD